MVHICSIIKMVQEDKTKIAKGHKLGFYHDSDFLAQSALFPFEKSAFLA